MNLRTKTIGAILFTLGLLIAGQYGHSKFILEKGFSDVETREAKLNVGRVQDAIQTELSNLEGRMLDWSSWDDTYQYIQDQNKDYEKSNLVSSALFNLKHNLFLFINLKGEIVFGRKIDFHQEKEFPVPQEIVEFIKTHPKILNHGTQLKNHNGLVVFSDGPMLISAQPILTSESKGPVQGTLLVGRTLDKKAIQRLSQVIHLQLDMSLWNKAESREDFQEAKNHLSDQHPMYISPLNDSQVAGYTFFKDFQQRPALIIRMDTPREVYAHGQKTMMSMLVSILVQGLCLMAVIVFILDRSVLGRILKLNRGVSEIGQSGDLTLRVSVSGQDEIANLGAEMNRMLGSLERNQKSIRLLLDNADQGFLSFDGQGVIGKECSKAVETIFQIKPEERPISALFQQPEEKWQEYIKFIFEEILPFEDTSYILPKSITLHDRIIELKYRAIREAQGTQDQKLTDVLVVATDVTELRQIEKVRQEEAELNQCLIRILTYPSDFRDMLEQFHQLDQASGSVSKMKMALHTLKGLLGYFGLKNLAMSCHAWEVMVETHSLRDIVLDLQQQMEKFLRENQKILNMDLESDKTVAVPASTLLKAIELSNQYSVPAPMRQFLEYLVQVPVKDRLGWMDRAYQASAEKLGKIVAPLVWPTNQKLPFVGHEDLFRAFIHIVRNSADHGIETPDVRREKGKSEMGKMIVTCEEEGEFYVLSFSDDGAGVDIEKVRQVAQERGLVPPPLSGIGLEGVEGEGSRGGAEEDILDLIFSDGFSTKDEISETSGRGVGLNAIREEARKLGGDVKAVNSPGQGLKIVVWFSRQQGIQPQQQIYWQAA